MTLAIVLVVIAILCLFFILRIAVSRSLQVSADASLAGQIQPIDVEAFRNLANPSEDDFLRRRLPAGEFRKVRRERLRAMAAYVRTAGRNATVLVRIGQTGVESGDPQATEAARQLVDQALLLRRNAAFALIKIQIALLWPNSGLAAAGVLLGYERLNGSALRLTRLQNPAAPVRILAS